MGKRFLIFNVLVALVYMVLAILISFIFAFPGFGVLILPQPFLDVVRGRWTLAYNPVSLSAIPWAFYIIAIHCVYYNYLGKSYLSDVLSDVKAPVLGGISVLVLNLILILTGCSDIDLHILLLNYMSEPIYWISAILVNVVVEGIAFKIARKISIPN
ncbi:hypothetical protein Asulf_01278 [Archaeoglobus sulfaticallidus PM70-1]|uniref:Uncharacterized protein n=1 Tax=Archaeoglobus sulfaticallidus PM70-1 TaxID=387631 RepID=N0BG44_9EURY|nr:hypothetical protein [Archaeoglobus sulfaticallidus]AGK61272.1 hypothetical protein Asulf_01278 [Archaeoglobus sulfaticallidus PM70-1]